MPSQPGLAPASPAALDRLARLAASAVGARAGAVTLLRDGVLCTAGRHALPGDDGPAAECLRIVATRAAVVVGDTYAGVPVWSAGGSVIGTLCVLGRDRPWTGDDVTLLADVAASVAAEVELRAAEERVEVAERRFRALVEHVPAVIYSCDYDEAGLFHYVSPQMEELTGLPAERFLGDPQRWLDAVHPDDRERVARQIEEDYDAERGFEAEYRMVAVDGTVRWVWDRESIVRDGSGAPVYGQGVVVDLTPMRATQEALETAQRQLSSIISVAPLILTAVDAEGYVTFVDGRGLDALGMQPREIVGRHALEITPAAGWEAVRGALRGETTSATLTIRDVTFDVSWQPVLGPGGEIQSVVSVAIDATARRTNEAHLRFIAHHDALTGIANRSLLELEIAERSGDVAVLVVDVDGFKTVNDSLGHGAGDDVLRELARRLAAVAGDHGAFLARVGADEFALLISAGEGRHPRAAAEQVADAALTAIREPIAVAGSEFVVNASSGGAIGAPSLDLLRHADIALGQAKLDAMPLAWHVGDIDDDARGRLMLTARIRHALANDEFCLHYQPIYSLADDRLSGMEALIRWNDPERGLVAPDDFIPAAEASGLIDDIGRWVVHEVCRQARAWADEGMCPTISFNVAPRELRRPDFARGLAEAIERHGVDPRRLVVEITERAAMREPARTDAVLRQLQEIGVLVAIDDFGADHSSLARLRALKVDILKIDRDFLRGVPDEGDAAAIVTAVLSLAGALGMTAVAEGVETAEQLRFLRSLGCDRVQGYHVARPMSARRATAWVRRGATLAPRARGLREVA